MSDTDTNIELADDLKRFIHQEIADQRFSSPREAIEAGLLLLQERETRLAALRSLMEESEQAAAAAQVLRSDRRPA